MSSYSFFFIIAFGSTISFRSYFMYSIACQGVAACAFASFLSDTLCLLSLQIPPRHFAFGNPARLNSGSRRCENNHVLRDFIIMRKNACKLWLLKREVNHLEIERLHWGRDRKIKPWVCVASLNENGNTTAALAPMISPPPTLPWPVILTVYKRAQDTRSAGGCGAARLHHSQKGRRFYLCEGGGRRVGREARVSVAPQARTLQTTVRHCPAPRPW